MSSVTSLLRRARRRDDGAELLELAVALPILILVVAGIADFAMLFQQYDVVTNAAREGARIGTLPDYSTADVQSRVTSYLNAAGLTAAAPTPTVAYTNVAAGAKTISLVTVTVRYPHQYIILGPAAALVGGGSFANSMLTARSSMRREIAAP